MLLCQSALGCTELVYSSKLTTILENKVKHLCLPVVMGKSEKLGTTWNPRVRTPQSRTRHVMARFSHVRGARLMLDSPDAPGFQRRPFVAPLVNLIFTIFMIGSVSRQPEHMTTRNLPCDTAKRVARVSGDKHDGRTLSSASRASPNLKSTKKSVKKLTKQKDELFTFHSIFFCFLKLARDKKC